MKRLYLDHAATTPVHPEVVESISESLTHYFGNASSTYQRGRDSRGQLDLARQVFADSIGAHPNEIIITSGGSESNNTAILKTAEKFKADGKHIITTAIEHQSVLKPMQYLESLGYDVTYLPINQDGSVDIEDFKAALRDDTILVSMMYGNNELGSIMPVKEIGELLDEHQAYFHIDAVQVYGKLPIDVKELQADFLSVSAHKINGPKGIGFLYVNDDVHIPSLILGGEQESKRRAGTENIPYIIGFSKAVSLRMDQLADYQQQTADLKAYFLSELDKHGVEYTINGSLDSSLSHIANIHIHGVSSEKLLIQLDLAGVEAAAGSACTAGNLKPSHVLLAIYDDNHPAIAESLRFSFGYPLTKEDIDQAIDALIQEIDRLKD